MSYSQCCYHIAFRTKDSMLTISPEYELYNYIAGLVRDLKTATSFWMKDENKKFPYYEGWAIGYAILSCGYLEKEKIIDYIQNQKSHHSNMSFMNEIRNIFQQYHIEVDEEYFDRNI